MKMRHSTEGVKREIEVVFFYLRVAERVILGTVRHRARHLHEGDLEGGVRARVYVSRLASPGGAQVT